VLYGGPDSQGKGRFGVRTVANSSQTVSHMLPPREYKRAIPSFVKLLWSLFAVETVYETTVKRGKAGCWLEIIDVLSTRVRFIRE